MKNLGRLITLPVVDDGNHISLTEILHSSQ
jgi:hypothetical protein